MLCMALKPLFAATFPASTGIETLNKKRIVVVLLSRAFYMDGDAIATSRIVQYKMSLKRRNAEETAVSEVEQRTKRYCAPISSKGDRSQPGADDAPGGVLDESAVHPHKGGDEEAAFRAALYRRGHPLAGIGRRRPRGSIGTGSAAHPATRIHRFRQAGVPEPGRHFGVAHLQSPGLENLRGCARAHDAHPSAPGVRRRAAEAGSAGAARLSAGRPGAPGSPGRPAGGVPYQRG